MGKSPVQSTVVPSFSVPLVQVVFTHPSAMLLQSWSEILRGGIYS